MEIFNDISDWFLPALLQGGNLSVALLLLVGSLSTWETEGNESFEKTSYYFYLLSASIFIGINELWAHVEVIKHCRFYFTFGGRSSFYFFISLPMMGSFSKQNVGYGFLQATAIIMILLAVGYAVLSVVDVVPFSFRGLIQSQVNPDYYKENAIATRSRHRTRSIVYANPLLDDGPTDAPKMEILSSQISESISSTVPYTNDAKPNNSFNEIPHNMIQPLDLAPRKKSFKKLQIDKKKSIDTSTSPETRYSSPNFTEASIPDIKFASINTSKLSLSTTNDEKITEEGFEVVDILDENVINHEINEEIPSPKLTENEQAESTEIDQEKPTLDYEKEYGI